VKEDVMRRVLRGLSAVVLVIGLSLGEAGGGMDPNGFTGDAGPGMDPEGFHGVEAGPGMDPDG
jgi:hypothetical protein